MDPNRDKDQDEHSRPGLPRPGKQVDHDHGPGVPPQASMKQTSRSNEWTPPHPSNPDLDPFTGHSRPQLPTSRDPHNEPLPLTPQGMLFDPRQLVESRRDPSYDLRAPPGARFDPYGPPDPDSVVPGRSPTGRSQFGVPDPDHFQPPGMPQLPRGKSVAKSLKGPWSSGGSNFHPGAGGSSGGPFL